MMQGCCPICDSNNYAVFHRISETPIHVGALWETREAARACPRSPVVLAFCSNCGFIGNTAFNPQLMNYSLTYDNALHFSSVFQKYEVALAQRLIERYGIRNKSLIEIGCGTGHFSGLLCELGNNRGYGFDPSYEPARTDPLAKGRVAFIRDSFSAAYGDYMADLVCCRQVLEHIQNPSGFVRMIHKAVRRRPDTILYFEVPNTRLILQRLSIWDIVYEHCDYFTAESLMFLFEHAGFEVLDLRETYDAQFLSIELRPAQGNKSSAQSKLDLANLAEDVELFSKKFSEKKKAWQARMIEHRSAGKQVVVWGGGARAVSFLNMLGVSGQIDYVVDINPGKQDMFLAGGGQSIVPPEFLKSLRPDTVVIMNPVYEGEIREALSGMELSPNVLTV